MEHGETLQWGGTGLPVTRTPEVPLSPLGTLLDLLAKVRPLLPPRPQERSLPIADSKPRTGVQGPIL